MRNESSFEKNFEIRPYSKGELAGLYGIHYATLATWLVERQKIFTREYYNSIIIFTPKEVSLIIEAIGAP
jgi:hypothetical protein